MKLAKCLLWVIVFGAGCQLLAGNEELITLMRKQQKQAETDIVRLWAQNERGKELEQIVSDYVVREVRLRSISGTNNTGSLLSALVQDDNAAYDSPQAIAQALVIEHYRRQGVDLGGQPFVAGTYFIRSQNLTPGNSVVVSGDSTRDLK